jgi:septum formation protein
MNADLILASASPRRVELLRNLGLSFRVLPSAVEENFADHLSPEQVVIELAERKARAVQQALEPGQSKTNPYIIAADTIVVLGDEILGKPADKNDAAAMLSRLSGRCHQVFTGVCVLHGEQSDAQAERSNVVFRSLSPAEIACYVATEEPMDKAGAYAVQGIGAFMIERIEGCITNIIGLPVVRTLKMLRAAGLSVMESVQTSE